MASTPSQDLKAASRNNLVVMLGYRAAQDTYNVQEGAGILIYQDENRAIIVTAQHNLPERRPTSPNFKDERIYVEFFSASRRDFPARVLNEDEELDLAVLEVNEIPISPDLFKATRDVLIPEGAEVIIKDGAFAVGNPNGRHWFQNFAPEPIIEKITIGEKRILRFASSVADVGMSGGALFSEHGALLGMVQRISGGTGGPQALSTETIIRKLERWKIPFSLQENPDVIRSISRKILTDLDLASAAGLQRALEEESPDFGLLHLFWLGGIEQDEVEAGLSSLVSVDRTALASQVFNRLGKTENCRRPEPGSSRLSAEQLQLVHAGLEQLDLPTANKGTCSGQLRIWIRGLVQGGLDPNLVVASSYYPREALLAVAMGSTNGAAMLALLENGASPHAFQDLSGTEYPTTSLLHPLSYVVQRFVGAEQETLRKAFISAGLVVTESIRNSYHNHHQVVETFTGLPMTPTLSEADTDPICLRAGNRYNFNWCGFLRSLGSTIRFKTGTQRCDPSGYCSADLTHTLFVGEHSALLLAERRRFNDPPEPIVIEVTREPGQWYAWERADTYRCIAREDGFEPTTCWSRFAAFPTSFQLTEDRSAAERAKATLRLASLDGIKVEGISLSTPLHQALTILKAAGYTTDTIAAPDGQLNMAATWDFILNLGATTRQLKVIAMNDDIRALSLRIYSEKSSEFSFKPPGVKEMNLDFYDNTITRNGQEVLAIEKSGLGKSFMRFRSWPTSFASVEIDLLRRPEGESSAEHAFYQSWLNDWVGKVEIPTSAQGPCIDRYAHLRGPAGNGCQTPKERANSYLDKVRNAGNIRHLASGLYYEVLLEGQGPSPSLNSPIVADVVFKYLDGARKDDTINNWQTVVRNARWQDLKEALLSMKEGDKWRIYVPPGVGSNDSQYLQLTEIQLSRVNGG